MVFIPDILVWNYNNFPLNVISLTESREEERKKNYFVSDETVSEVPFVRVCTKRNLESDEMSDNPVYESVQIPECWNNEEVP